MEEKVHTIYSILLNNFKLKELFSNYVINKYLEQDEGDIEYFNHKRHIFIFTLAGKPVYCRYFFIMFIFIIDQFIRYGDEIKLSSFIASLSTIYQKLILPHNKDDPNSSLRYIENESTKGIFVMRQKLCFMILTKDKSDPLPYLINIIEYLNIQVSYSIFNS